MNELKKYRFAFVMDQQVGLRTQALNLERVVIADPSIEAVWVPVTYQGSTSLVTRLPGLPSGIRGTLSAIQEIREGLKDAGPLDGILWATWAAKSVPDLVDSAPSFLLMDMTPTQMLEMGDLYGYSKKRANFLGGFKRRATLSLYNQSQHLFPWNDWVADSLKRDYDVPTAKITSVSPGVDVDLYCPDASVKPTDGVVRLLFVGGNFARKGGDLLLRWARETRVSTPWELHIVTRDEVPVTPGVTVHKSLTNNSPELVRLYQQSDLFVLPTRADCYSLVGLEAMASGLPVIISSLGGIPEIVQDGVNGYLLKPDDTTSLFAYLDRLVDDQPLRAALGAAARRRAVEKFDCRLTMGNILHTMKQNVSDSEPQLSMASGTHASGDIRHVTTQKRPRIAFLTESYTMGGVERSTTTLIGNLHRDKFEPILICAQEPAISPMVHEVEAMGVRVVQTDLLSTRHTATMMGILQLARLLKSLDIDVLHIQVLGGTGARYVTIAASLAHIPVVIKTIRGASLKRLSQLNRIVTRLIDKTVTLYTTASEDNKQLQIRHVGRNPSQVRVIYNAIDPGNFDPNMDIRAARLGLPVPQDKIVIGTLGRLEYQKGIEYFIRMAGVVSKSVSGVAFMIVGEGELREEYESLVRDLGLEDIVFFTGYRADVARCLAAMDIFVLASVFEPFGLALAEAMAMQKPIVATCVGGIPEVILHDKTGLLVEPHDAQALADAVLAYLQDPEMGRTHGLAGRERTWECFSTERLIREIEALYQELLPDKILSNRVQPIDTSPQKVRSQEKSVGIKR